jgi:DNA-binding GntR family transcriptional regulator
MVIAFTGRQQQAAPASAPKSRKSDSAYALLKDLILRGHLTPGTFIEEAALCAEHEIGRTPFREALLRLAQDELVESVPRRGYLVAPIRASDLHDIFEMRTTLDARAAALAAERRSDEDIERMDAFLEEARQGIAEGITDLGWNLAEDETFHRLVAEASGNVYILSSVLRLHGLAVRALYLTGAPMTLVRDEIDNFTAVIEAIRARDAKAADPAMRGHLGDGELAWQELLLDPRRHAAR